MKIKTCFFQSLFLLATVMLQSLTAQADGDSNRGTIEVKIAGVPNNKGKVLVAVCASIEEFTGKKEFSYKAALVSTNGTASCDFKDVAFGEYAVKAFHDENGNEKLDTSLFGIPTEKYAISNQVRDRPSAKTWEKAKFTLDSNRVLIELTLK